MVLQGLKSKILAFDTITRTHDITFVKYRHMSSHFITKCAHLVYKMTKCALNRDTCSLMFFYMIYAYAKFQKTYLASYEFLSS